MSRIVTPSPQQVFDAILERICVNLQITQTQYDVAQTAHESVCEWLSERGSPLFSYTPFLYPQGSLKLDTTVRPMGQEEFDLDIVCFLNIRAPFVDPRAVYELIWDRLYAHGTYRKMMTRKQRCIRLNYSGQFHLDVVPAVPDLLQGGSCIKVPDLPKPYLKSWKPSNPLGYAQWFDKMTMKRPRVIKMSAAEAKSYDPLRAPKPAHLKKPLRLAVQLYKRWRDITFADRKELAPPSIILTTMAGHYYDGEEDHAEALYAILNTTVAALRGPKLELKNPVNDAEFISERWRDNPDSYDAFIEEVTAFRDCWRDLSNSRGLREITSGLTALFGETAGRAVREAFSDVDEARSAQRLYATGPTRTLVPAVAPVLAPASAAKVRGNTFHGN